MPELSPAPVGEIIATDSTIAPHCQRPEFREYVARLTGTPLAAPWRPRAQPVLLPDTATARHTFVVGSTGFGKTFASIKILLALLEAGGSALVLDPKGETIDRLLHWAAAAGFPPQRLILVDPQCPEATASWNLLGTGVPGHQAVADFVDVMARTYASSWGQRLQSLLENGTTLVASHPDPSLYEVTRLLGMDDYRERLIEATLRRYSRRPAALEEAIWFLRYEYGRWPPSVRTEAASAVLNKLRPIIRSEFLSALLCARRQTLDLAALWQQSHLVLVRLDRPTLGEENVRILGGLLAHGLYRTSLRSPGPVPVVCLIDELPIVAGLVGGILSEILAVARSQNLRLILACQHFEQLAPELRAALMANAAVQLAFHLGHADARLIAASLAVGTEPKVSRAVARVDQLDRQTGQPVLAEARLPVLSPEGSPLRLSASAWAEVAPQREGQAALQAMQALQALAMASGIARLYVQPDGGEPVALHHYVADLPPAAYGFSGPAPVELIVQFPRPHLSRVERWTESDCAAAWTRTLQRLPVQHVVARIAGGDPVVARVDDFTVPAVSPRALASYTAAVAAAHGQSADEVEATRRWRRERIEQLTRGYAAPPEEDEDDESIG